MSPNFNFTESSSADGGISSQTPAFIFKNMSERTKKYKNESKYLLYHFCEVIWCKSYGFS